MNARVSKARTRHSRVQPSEALQEKLLDAVASATAGEHVVVSGAPGDLLIRHSSGTEPLQSHREPSPALSADATLSPARKRRGEATTPPRPKRARLTQADTQQLEVGEEEAVQADEPAQTTLAQPKPKSPCPSFLKDFVDPVHPDTDPAPAHTSVSEWLESVGSDREKRCRSDGYLGRSDHDLISRQLTRSVPNMGYTQDADGFAVPPTPSTTGSRRSRRSTAEDGSQYSTPSTTGVRNRLYRQNNLRFNNIYVRHPDAPLPEFLSNHIQQLRADRDSPGPSSDELKQYTYEVKELRDGCIEDDVAALLNTTVFPNPKSDSAYGPATGLASSSGIVMSQHLVPTNPATPFRVSQPTPDKLYGYSGKSGGAFTSPQLLAQTMLHPQNPVFPMATSSGLRFPFFAIEFKAAGGTQGDLWVATNQCAGDSSACLNAVDQLNTLLPVQHEKVQRVDNLSYCIAVDNNVAQLYISWKEKDLDYYLQEVDAFLLSSPEHFKNFRKQVRNILDWGKDTRLNQIKDALDIILKESRKKAADHAKSRQPPSDGSATRNSKRPKSASSRKNSSRSNSVQARGGETDERYWEGDGTALQDACPEVEQHGQGQACVPLDPVPATSLATTTSFESSFDTQRDSYAPPSSSYDPPQPHNFVDVGDYTSQATDFGSVPQYHYDQGQTPVLPDSGPQASYATYLPTSYATGPPLEEQPADDWTWSSKRNNWYRLGEDGSREWYSTKRGSHK